VSSGSGCLTTSCRQEATRKNPQQAQALTVEFRTQDVSVRNWPGCLTASCRQAATHRKTQQTKAVTVEIGKAGRAYEQLFKPRDSILQLHAATCSTRSGCRCCICSYDTSHVCDILAKLLCTHAQHLALALKQSLFVQYGILQPTSQPLPTLSSSSTCRGVLLNRLCSNCSQTVATRTTWYCQTNIPHTALYSLTLLSRSTCCGVLPNT
jgi:hypothetical protein